MEEKLEAQLTSSERNYLTSARTAQFEVYALESYANLWDELDARLGEGNEIVKASMAEYQGTEYSPPRDEYERQRVQMMRVSFVLSRLGMPPEVRLALLLGGR